MTRFSTTVKSGSRLSICGTTPTRMRASRAACGTGWPDHLDRAAVRVDEAEAAAQRRRLARAVRPEQAEALAATDRERQPAHDLLRAVALAQALHAQHVVGLRRRRPAGRGLAERLRAHATRP